MTLISWFLVGPNAGEVTQGFAAGFVGNLTFEEWNLVVGIHPTVCVCRHIPENMSIYTFCAPKFVHGHSFPVCVSANVVCI